MVSRNSSTSFLSVVTSRDFKRNKTIETSVTTASNPTITVHIVESEAINNRLQYITFYSGVLIHFTFSPFTFTFFKVNFST